MTELDFELLAYSTFGFDISHIRVYLSMKYNCEPVTLQKCLKRLRSSHDSVII